MNLIYNFLTLTGITGPKTQRILIIPLCLALLSNCQRFPSDRSHETTAALLLFVNLLRNPLPDLSIFITAGSYRPVIDFDSPTSADALCEADLNNPGKAVYKALIVSTNRRVASLAPDSGNAQLDWVLQPERTYRRVLDSRIIQRSDRHGLFPFPLNNTVSSETVGNITWTGLNTDWTIGANCNSWNTTTGSGNLGNPEESTSALLFDFSGVCTGISELICVEQP